MKKIYLLLLCISFASFGQNYLEPTLKKSIGIKHHTSRDVAKYITKDSNNNTILTISTERDSTFADVQTIKLDSNLQEIWSMRYSADTYLSYDEIQGTTLDSQNNIYTWMRSFTSTGYYGGDAKGVVIKYDTSGAFKWDLDLGICTIELVAADLDNQLHIVYKTISTGPYQVIWHFATVGQDGAIVNEFTHANIMPTGADANLYDLVYKLYLKGNQYYCVYRYLDESSSGGGNFKHFIKKISPDEIQTYSINAFLTPSATNFFGQHYFDVNLSNNSLYLAYNLPENKFRAMKLNSDGGLVFTTESAIGYNSALTGMFIATDGKMGLLHNSKLTASAEQSSLTKTVYNDTGGIAENYTTSNYFADVTRLVGTENIIAYTNGSFTLFDTHLQPVTAYSVFYNELTDFLYLNNNSLLVINNQFSTMFPGSYQYAQANVQVDKIQGAAVAATYTFNGEGTSKMGGTKLVVLPDNTSYMITEHKLGEDTYVIGAPSPPTTSVIIKYDQELNQVWQLDSPYYIINPNGFLNYYVTGTDNSLYINCITDYETMQYRLVKINPDGTIAFDMPSVQAENIYRDQNGNINILQEEDTITPFYTKNVHIFTYSGTTGVFVSDVIFFDRYYFGNKLTDGHSYVYMSNGWTYNPDTQSKNIYTYKNLEQISSHELDVMDQVESARPLCILSDGTLYIHISKWPQETRIAKLSTNGNFTVYPMPADILAANVLANGTAFVYHSDGSLKIYNTDFGVIYNNPNMDAGLLQLTPAGNNMLISSTDEDASVIAMSQTGENLANFRIQGRLDDYLSGFDSNGNLIVSGSFGRQLTTYSYIAWNRGFIHKYDIQGQILSGNEVKQTDTGKISVFPNPGTGLIHIISDNKIIERAALYDLTGKKIQNINKVMFDISGLQAGLYVLRCETDKGPESIKIIKH
jgi:Secretion system C-terminal sorting domain